MKSATFAEALAALRLFQEAARREEVTAELVQELAVFFRDARVDPFAAVSVKILTPLAPSPIALPPTGRGGNEIG